MTAPQSLDDLLAWANGILVAYGGPGWATTALLGALVVAIAVALLAAAVIRWRRAG